MDIYVKPEKKALMQGKTTVSLRDIAQIHAPNDIKEDVLGITIFERKNMEERDYLVSITDIIDKILKSYPNATISNVGEMDTVVEFEKIKKPHKIFDILKIIFVSVVLFTGCVAAIMSFHSDAQMYKVFEKFTELFLGKESDIKIIQISYSVGLAVGITVFFNHLGGKKMTNDPTPIQVEMATYETAVNDTVISIINNQKKGL